MRGSRIAGIVLVVVLVFGTVALAACGGSTESSDKSMGESTTLATPSEVPTDETQASSTPDEQQPQDVLAKWMTGSWKVRFKLRSVTPNAGWAQQAADQPAAQWSCKVKGSRMVIDAGMHVYTGTFSVAKGSSDDWLYDGEATWLDEDGVTWTSHIVVEGTRTGDDAFTADQGGEISSDSDGTLYTAEWDAVGKRAP